MNAAEKTEAEKPTEIVAEETKQPVDPFDKNTDGKIDVTDWKMMDEKEKRAYARKLVIDLGKDPDASLGGLGTREEQYLQGLKKQFEE
ncbi:MAG: hypothetical protein Q9M28_06290 [Mariprofundaceae bacterium]|nr:hypothetical protein [Mariprofundaceae bacterium]